MQANARVWTGSGTATRDVREGRGDRRLWRERLTLRLSARAEPPPTLNRGPRSGGRARGDRRGRLLQLDAAAGLLDLRLELVGLLALDALLDRLGGLVHERLGLLEAEAGRRADDLDDLDLLVARPGEDGVDRGALPLLAGAVARRGRGRRGRGDSRRRDP